MDLREQLRVVPQFENLANKYAEGVLVNLELTHYPARLIKY